ncbi:MAG TPA: hypothetical protein VMZ91_16340 [Candidatus Paceibacterota bacterium]|nr:hypothetical protein [Candidatus Paceibacterota bacterium]
MICQCCKKDEMILTRKLVFVKKLNVFYVCKNCGQRLTITYPTEIEKMQ